MKIFYYSILLFSSYLCYGQESVIEIFSPNMMKSGIFGTSMIMLNDITNDSFHDFIISAPGELQSGRVYFFDGATYSSFIELKSPNAELYGGFGTALSNVGDINNDSFEDILISAPYEDPGTSVTNSGRVYCFSGKDTSLIHEIRSPVELPSGEFGKALSGIDDLNDDGINDFIISCGGAFPAVYVISGKDTSTIHIIKNPVLNTGTHWGDRVASAGDLNDDGYEEILVSAYGADLVYIYNGKTGEIYETIKSPSSDSFVSFGWAIDGGIDINNDDIPDIIIGSPNDNPTLGLDTPEVGRAHIFSGADLTIIQELKSPIEQKKSKFGINATFGGDMNNDGVPEIFVSTMEPSEGSPAVSGKVHIFNGKDLSFIRTLSSLNETYVGHFGFSISADMDLDNDGFIDILIGANYEDDQDITKVGHAYLFDGKITANIENRTQPRGSDLFDNYPNPFNPKTKITFQLANFDHVTLKILNVNGQEITTLIDRHYSAGQHEVDFYGTNIASGIYFYQLISTNYVKIKKMILLK